MTGPIEVRTTEREQMVDITSRILQRVRDAGTRAGVIHIWAMHTTCALTVNEGADPDVQRDIVTTLRRLAPHQGDYHHAEGNSDSHIKTLITGPGLTLLIEDGKLVLGTWQRVFLCEYDGPRTRNVAVRISADG